MKALNKVFLEEDIYVQVEALSTMIGVSKMSITNYVKDGMPFINIEASKTKHFPILECLKWLIVRGLFEIKQPIPDRLEDENFDLMDSIEAKRRQDVAKAKLMEMEVSEAEGQLIRVEEALKENNRVLVAFRARILSIPSSVAPSIVTCETVAEANAMLTSACYDALDELSRLE